MNSTKLTGIKTVDLKIEASGSGVVNWNGSFKLKNPQAEQYVENHRVPKLRGIDPFMINSLDNPELNKATMFISQNSVRHALFAPETFGLSAVTNDNVNLVLSSLLGLVRGYVITENKSSLKRKSCLLLEDFVNMKGAGYYEQFVKSGEATLVPFSCTNFGDTSYVAYASINIEDLQFIPVEDTFNRSAFKLAPSKEDCIELAKSVEDYVKTLDSSNKLSPKVEFYENALRVGNIMKIGEGGLLLNDDAIHLVVSEIVDRFANLYIHQSKGYVKVDKVSVDYNSSPIPMRIKTDIDTIKENKGSNQYAVYYVSAPANVEFDLKMKSLKKKDDERKNSKEEKKEAKKAKALKNSTTSDVETESAE